MATEVERSKLELLKESSRYLSGNIEIELQEAVDHFTDDSVQLLKHHGTYQQDDRDLRNRKLPDGTKAPKAYSLMIRSKIPGGRMTSDQLLAHLAICDDLADHTLRITSRQALQFHGVLKGDLRKTIQRINECGITTLGACGDVGRNVMCCPAPFRQNSIRDELQETARRVSDHLLPHTDAYQRIWLDGSSQAGTGEEIIEPIYGRCYLPRKFKIGMALPEDNCIDIHTHDLGFLANCEGGKIIGYNVLVGGGMGVTPSNPKTFPALSQPVAFVPCEQILQVTTAVAGVYRDFGNRADRKRARLKYIVADWGVPRFKEKLEEYYGGSLEDPRPVTVHDAENHIGWFQQGDGRWFLGLNVENGRLIDRDRLQWKTALRSVCEEYRPGIRFTAQQSILLTDIRSEDKDGIEQMLRRHGVKLKDEVSTLRLWSMACVALPTCPLSVAESERALPGFLDKLEPILSELDLEDEPFSVHMTGCPNGCSRPYNADIGLVGRGPGKYAIYLGGSRIGHRLAFLFEDRVPLDEILNRLKQLFSHFQRDRRDQESFGDYCHRIGCDALTNMVSAAN